MEYFYADGPDKAGNRLLTSYKKESQAKQYRAGAKITQGQRFLEITDEGKAKMSLEDNGLLVRTLMMRKDGDEGEMKGPFVVFARINGVWQQTDFRYKNYALANSAVKSALINIYPACAVVEMDEGEPASKTSAPVETDLDEAVF